MALDRGTLTKIDRRVFAELNHTHGVQTVKVPVSDAFWSTWRRYCEAIGLSMGEAVAGLISHELEALVDADGTGVQVFSEQAHRHAKERSSRLDARQHELDTRTEVLRRKEEHLKAWEQRLQTQRVDGGQVQGRTKVGRNERCPCNSGLKYKHCHGLPGRTG
jgi:uncharacterized protein YchJ